MKMLLRDVPGDIRSVAVAQKWLAYLLQQVDHEGLKRLLDYYQSIGLISSEAREKLLTMAAGIKSTARGEFPVPGRVHIVSLLFMAYLSNSRIPPELYEVNTYARLFAENPEQFLSV